MNIRTLIGATGALLVGSLPALCQSAPIYRITVVQRSLNAINYQYRTGPTRIDFQGTVLLPKAKGEAVVDSNRGRTQVEAKFENLPEPTRFGREYLAYVLWAVSPEGRPHNMGEIIPNGSDKAKFVVTTDMQAFGMIVTAEPYSAVRRPSDVVVMENRVRPDTMGKIEEIQARYELMPRGHYTWEEPANLQALVNNAPKVSMDRYEALLEFYQAQNAVGIARVAYADQYAPNTFAKAQQLLTEAQRLLDLKGASSLVVQNAREAAQTAEDARVIADKRREEEKVTRAQADVSSAHAAQAQADAEAQRARAEADSARAQADAERLGRQRAEADAALARQQAAQAAAQASAEASRRVAVAPTPQPVVDPAEGRRSELRMRLLELLNGALVARDTPRGLTVVVSDNGFRGPALREPMTAQVARVAAIVAANPGLKVDVEGNTDSVATEALARQRAEAVRYALLGAGLPAGSVTARGLGDSRPVVSNATAAGREENRRVEIVISGDPIGGLPFWDRPYSLNLK